MKLDLPFDGEAWEEERWGEGEKEDGNREERAECVVHRRGMTLVLLQALPRGRKVRCDE